MNRIPPPGVNRRKEEGLTLSFHPLSTFLLPLTAFSKPMCRQLVQWTLFPCNCFYYMGSSASGQDDPNCVMWLATWVGKMEPSCPLGTTCCIPQEKFPQKPCNKILYWSSLFGQDGWVLALFFFCEFMDLNFVSVYKHAKRNLANNQPSWLNKLGQ